jgi:cytochrome oxidase Cu insertion factor (SCO1/SenC/PrrC family)
MPGMTSGVNTNDPVLEAAFRAALWHQCGIVAAIALLVMLVYGLLRVSPGGGLPGTSFTEPAARRLLRVSFGILWIIDGILQAQPQMAAGLPSQVSAPVAGASPDWVQAVVNAGGTIWSFHPVQAAAAAVWIQLGLGLWLLMAPRGWWSRLAGLGTIGWGLVVWIFGEAFGGIFAPGLSWLNGAPGSVVLYIIAGSLLALPARAWAGQRLGRLLLGCSGAFWLGLAVLQAWPGRGYWSGTENGTLASMIGDMAGLTQPAWQSRMINWAAHFAANHAFLVNLIAVLALAAAGSALLAGSGLLDGTRARLAPGRLARRWLGPPRLRLLRNAVLAASVFSLIVWVVIQDFGVPGGLGTDPNSGPVWVLLLWAGYRAVATSPAPAIEAERSRPRSTRSLSVARLREAAATARAGMVASVAAFGIVLLGVAPLAAAAATAQADPLIAQAVSGQSAPVDYPAPGFSLVSQSGQPVSLASLRGKVTLLTFLDPRCVAACPVATELKQAGQFLGAEDSQVRLVAVAASQLHYSRADVQALDRADGLTDVPNWLYLTGSATQLQQTWGRYGIFVSHMAPGSSSVMTDLVFVIDGNGRVRQEIRDNPGPGTISTRSSFATLLSGAARQALGSS